MSRLVWTLLICLAAFSLTVSAAPFPLNPSPILFALIGGQSDLEARRQQPLAGRDSRHTRARPVQDRRRRFIGLG